MRISPSAVAAYDRCPRLFYYMRTKPAPSPRLEAGAALHALVEALARNGKA